MKSAQTAKRCLAALAFTCLGAAGAGFVSAEKDKKPDDKTIEKTKGEVPSGVKSSADSYFSGASWKSRTLTDGGEMYFEITGVKGDRTRVLQLTEHGDITKITTISSADHIPAVANSRFKREHDHSKVTGVYEVEQRYFLVEYEEDHDKHEIRMLSNGHMWGHEDRGPAKDKDDDKDKSKDKDKDKDKDQEKDKSKEKEKTFPTVKTKDNP